MPFFIMLAALCIVCPVIGGVMFYFDARHRERHYIRVLSECERVDDLNTGGE